MKIKPRNSIPHWFRFFSIAIAWVNYLFSSDLRERPDVCFVALDLNTRTNEVTQVLVNEGMDAASPFAVCREGAQIASWHHGSPGVLVASTLPGAQGMYDCLIAGIAEAIIKLCVNKDLAVMRLIKVDGSTNAQSVKPNLCSGASGGKIDILHLRSRDSSTWVASACSS